MDELHDQPGLRRYFPLTGVTVTLYGEERSGFLLIVSEHGEVLYEDDYHKRSDAVRGFNGAVEDAEFDETVYQSQEGCMDDHCNGQCGVCIATRPEA